MIFNRSLWLYLIIFVCIIVLFTATFNAVSFIYRPVFLTPISYAGFLILKGMGIPVIFSGPFDIPGFCEYRLPYSILQVTFGCTGIYALFILLAGICAFPGSLKSKAIGILIAIPVFFIYSILRLVIIGCTGYWFPDAVDFVHSFLMELINVGFVLFVYILWIRYVEKTSAAV